MSKYAPTSGINRVLVIRFSSLGDVVLLSCLFRELKNIFPQAKIDFVTLAEFSEIHSLSPHINEIISWPRLHHIKSLWILAGLLKINKNYDLVIDAHKSTRSLIIWLRYLFSKAMWLKLNKKTWQRQLLISFKFNILKKNPSRRQTYLDILKKFTNTNKLNNLSEIFVDESIEQRLNQKISLNKINNYIVVTPGASCKLKQWPIENFIKSCLKLSQNNHFIIVGGSDDDLSRQLADKLAGKAINLAGTLTILETCALLKHARYVISNDSALTHLAEAVGTPALVIYGPTVKEFGFTPQLALSEIIEVNLPCRPCSKNGSGRCKNSNYLECLTSITPEQVIISARKLEKSLN
ncbi:MAG: glycosyltransferase family 9 protein [SAR324 cluster bacterium]|nr:glycosyltransferase family 9 protein [SAR324 cluster bacterium]